MTTKEKIKKNLDELPEDLIEQIYQFVESIKPKNSLPKKRIQTFHLNGQFDKINIRQSAYE